MNTEEYHSQMRECSQKVTPYVTSALDELVTASLRSRRTKELVNAIHNRRAEKPRLREFLIEQAYLACCDKPIPKEVYVLGAAMEIYNLSTYIINWFLDEKGDIKDRSDAQRVVIEGMRLYDKANKMIRSLEINPEIKEKIIEGLVETNNKIYLGQGDDVDLLNIRNNVESLTLSEYLPLYEEACRRKCGYFLGYVAKIGVFLAGADEKTLKKLNNFGTLLGTGLQIVNDAGDNIPSEKASTVERPYQDQFADIQNGLVTLPGFILLQSEPKFIKYFGRKLNEKEKEDLYQSMKTINTFESTMRLTRQYQKNAKKELKILSKDKRSMLSKMTAILFNSKIYNFIKNK